MGMTRNQFDILSYLAEEGASATQRELASHTGKSVGTVNRTMGELTQLGWVQGGILTQAGVDALEPYRVKRLLIIAAGFGSRLVPITLNTPKPLVRVNGVRIIDTILDTATAIGITDITIVRGYLSEQFDQLLYKYPTIRFLENPVYNETNNISSAMCARYLYGGSYVCDADLIIRNPRLFQKYQYASNYLGIPVARTDDWCLKSKNGYITGTAVGGTDCHLWIGFSYWTPEDGARLAEHIRLAYEMPGGKERYWDQVPMDYFASEYKVEIRECSREDVVEIDSYRELKALDPSYAEI